MSTAMPQIPPRPTRAHDQTAGSGSTLGGDIPKIPPRPINRRLDRSISPQRESFARSPLNETTFLSNHGKASLASSGNGNASGADIPRRPSSVALPSIGQEGSEYAEVFGASEDLGTSPTQTRNVANDLKLYAPKPSLPTSSAKQRVSTVTRTDSGQAAAFGIGKASSDDKDPASRSLKAKASFASQTSNGTERPPSSADDSEHGIPEIGQRVPMYPNAGDVQAPSPSPYSQPFEKGIGFHNDGSRPRHHGRKASGRGDYIPPDAYGRFGHGQLPHDRFEKAYYEKHPELFKKELGSYGEGKPEWAMSSEDLNKIVRNTASRGAGIGTSPAVVGTPTEQIGFQALEESASRISSPRPQSIPYHSNTSDTHIESSLRKESFPDDEDSKAEFAGNHSKQIPATSEHATESEVEDEDVIHVDDPNLRKVYSSDSRFESAEDLGYGGEDDSHDEHGYSAPILASDEVAKEPFGFDLQPAVSPLNDRRGSAYEEVGYSIRSGSVSSVSGSRPTSRPGSIHGTIPGLRLPESTPLEDLAEYEPLFPEDEKNKEKHLTAVEKLKRPELKGRKFPSQDIWEDTPNSLQYTATVSSPQLPEELEKPKDIEVRDGETPQQAFARRQEELAEKESLDSESFLHHEKKKAWEKQAHLVDTRPGIKQRFPSRDIWEDTPDSLQLQTTVESPQIPEKEIVSPPDDRAAPATIGISSKPQVPARPAKLKSSESPDKPQPTIPDRPQRASQGSQSESTSPVVPTKAKPQVPARPSKPITRESSENIPLTTVLSNSSAKSVGSDQGSAAAAKPKPPVPARALGSKIAALQGGFMSDLNKRLQLGPQAPKKEETVPEVQEEEKEKAPLVDARKGRARGPARRAPAKSPAPAALPTESSSVCSLCTPSTLWQIDPEEDLVHIGSPEAEPPVITTTAGSKAAESEIPTLATNAAGEPVHEPTDIPNPTEKEGEPSKTLAEPEVSDSTAEPAPEPESEKEKPTPSSLSVEHADEQENLSASTVTLKPGEPQQLDAAAEHNL